MGAYMTLKILIHQDKVREFFKKYPGLKRVGYYYDDNLYKIIYCTAWLGYVEPVMMYDEYKEWIKDIWWIPISDSDDLVGRNVREKWYSCKKESKET